MKYSGKCKIRRIYLLIPEVASTVLGYWKHGITMGSLKKLGPGYAEMSSGSRIKLILSKVQPL